MKSVQSAVEIFSVLRVLQSTVSVHDPAIVHWGHEPTNTHSPAHPIYPFRASNWERSSLSHCIDSEVSNKCRSTLKINWLTCEKIILDLFSKTLTLSMT